MIQKYSTKSSFSDEMAHTIEQLNVSKFSFRELTTTLVKCAEQLDVTNDKLAEEVDSVLSFIESEFVK